MRFVLGFLFFLFAFAVSVATIYLCFRVVSRVTRYPDVSLINENNSAAALVLASSFLSVAIMVRSALYPINAVLQDFWLDGQRSFMEYLVFCGRSVGYLLLTVLLSLLAVATALKLFQILTPELNEEEQITRNNVAVGIFMAGVLIAFALLIEGGIRDFVNTLIPVRDLLQTVE